MNFPPPPTRVFFDSNIFIRHQWPKASGKLESVISKLEGLKILLCIPEVILLELRKHVENSILDTLETIKSHNQKLPYLEAISELPDIKEYLEEYDKNVSKYLKEHGFEIIPHPTIGIERLIKMAVDKHPPFEENDKGFRDTMQIFSIIEYLQKVNEKNREALFVTNDKIFKDSRIESIIQEAGVNLKILDSVDSLQEYIDSYVDVTISKLLGIREEAAKEALEGIITQIERYVKENYDFVPSQFHGDQIQGDVDQVSDLQVQEILKVYTSRPDDEGKVSLTFLFRCRLVLSVMIQQYRVTPEVSLRVGGIGVWQQRIMEAFRKRLEEKSTGPSYEFSEESVEKILVGEATASKEDEIFTNIEIASVALARRDVAAKYQPPPTLPKLPQPPP